LVRPRKRKARKRDSEDTINELALGRIGTDDEQVIAERICSTTGPYMRISVEWRDGADAGRALIDLNYSISEKLKAKKQVKIFVSH
jgi:hypothetical protein